MSFEGVGDFPAGQYGEPSTSMFVHPLIDAVQRVASAGGQPLLQLGRQLQADGRGFDPTKLKDTPQAGQDVLRGVRSDPASDEAVRELGGLLQSPAAGPVVLSLPPDLAGGAINGSSVVAHLNTTLASKLEAMPSQVGTTPSQVGPENSVMRAARRPVNPDDSKEAGLSLPINENFLVKFAALMAVLVLLAYVGIRLWDSVLIYQKEDRSGRLFYRVVVIIVELYYGMSAVTSTISRSRRQRLEMVTATNVEKPFAVDDILTLLCITDENAAAITASVESHYSADKPSLPFRVVLVAESRTPAVDSAWNALQPRHSNMLLFIKEELAMQEYVLDADDAGLQQALNVVLEENMYLGQVIFYTLDRLFLQHGHSISNAAISVMDASSVVDADNHYSYCMSFLQRPGFACVSTPTTARNKVASCDFLDTTGSSFERAGLSAIGADHKFVINPRCFMARGYSLWRVLRRMELENVDTQNLVWVTYAMHIESAQATLSAMTTHAPVTSVLAQTHAPTVLSQTLDRQAEGFDVAKIFDREGSFFHWNLVNPLRSPHDSARAAVIMEFMIVVVIMLTVFGDIAPWSTSSNLVAGGFLANYCLIMLFSLTTPYSLVSWPMVGSAMKHRVLTSAHAWLYFLNISRFGVDRRGHFRAVGETTTADLNTYKQRQQEEKEAELLKEADRAAKAKEAAEVNKKEKAAKAEIDAIAQKQARQDKAEAKKEEEAKKKEEARLAKEKEKLRRARRGPKPALAVAESWESTNDMERLNADNAEIQLFVGGPEPMRRRAAAGPVSEGWFKKSEPAAPKSENSGQTDASQPTGGNKSSKGKKALLAKPKPREIVVPKFNAPKVGNGGSRSGSGTLHRPHRLIKMLSIPIVAVLIILPLITIFFVFAKVLGPQAPINYTGGEILAGRSWLLSCALLGITVFLAAFVYVSYLGRFAVATTNRVSATIIIIISTLAFLVVGVLPFLSTAVLDSRNAAYDLVGLGTSNILFMASQATGPPYAAGGSGAANVQNGQSLEGGFVTGPGGAKVTYPQALALADLSFAALSHYTTLSSMPSVRNASNTAADDLRDILEYGAAYLVACHDEASNSLVAFVPESGQPSYVDTTAANMGTETYAAVTAAFAGMSVALESFEDVNPSPALLKTRARATFGAMQNQTARSYLDSYASLATAWPSDGARLEDDRLLAASYMLLATGEQQYRNAMNGYYTAAQKQRLGGLSDFTMAVDDHWWTANAVLMSGGDRSNSRYAEALFKFAEVWTDNADVAVPEVVNNGDLMLSEPASFTSSSFDSVAGPLGSTVRAMAYIVQLTASQDIESDLDRANACRAKGQLRNMMGLNDNAQSYFVGFAPDGAKQPEGVSSNSGSVDLKGALVHGPSINGAFQNGNKQNVGTSILNNSPMSLLVAALQSRNLEIQDCIGLRPRDSLAKSLTVEDSDSAFVF